MEHCSAATSSMELAEAKAHDHSLLGFQSSLTASALLKGTMNDPIEWRNWEAEKEWQTRTAQIFICYCREHHALLSLPPLVCTCDAFRSLSVCVLADARSLNGLCLNQEFLCA